MKKRFIIHIGPHKTGSTYIQKTLFENKNKLKEVGIVYPDTLNETHIAHHDLAEKLYTKQYSEANIILSDMKNTDLDILISSENFDRLDEEDVQVLAQALEGYHVEIVFFKRRLDDLLISSWQESIKHGGIESWSKYCFKHLLRPFSSEVLNNSNIVDLYANVFGKETIKIIDFDFAKELKNDISDLLFQAIEVPKLKGLGRKQSINQSMAYSIIEILRILNILYIEKNKKTPHHLLREKFILHASTNPNDKIVLKLKESIENSLETVNLNNTFIFNHLQSDFETKYKELILNSRVENSTIIERKYELPNEFWYMKSDMIIMLEELYVRIERYM